MMSIRTVLVIAHLIVGSIAADAFPVILKRDEHHGKASWWHKSSPEEQALLFDETKAVLPRPIETKIRITSLIGKRPTKVEPTSTIQNVKADSSVVLDELQQEGCEIGFEGIKILLKQKGKKPDRVILNGSLKGVAKPGRMLAIMGPSGSGKSSLSHALAGRIKESKNVYVEGNRYVNGIALPGDSGLPAAVIEQDVNFFPHMTVKETLDFRAELKLGSQNGKSARDDIVSELMERLGLTKSANTIVGNAKVRGLSGGEKKRLSIACELISSPPVLILDEPTSGLDSYQAAQVTKFLRKLADSGKTIISVIHQPSQNVFAQFDDLLLVSEGRLMYYGEVSKVRSYLHNLGYMCSKDTGTAEHVLDCISTVRNAGADEEAISDERLDHLAEEAQAAVAGLSMAAGSSSRAVTSNHQGHRRRLTDKRKVSHSSMLRQFALLTGRALNEATRGKGTIIIKVVQQITLALVYGVLYKVGNDQASVMDRYGLLSLITVGALSNSLGQTIRSFSREKVIVANEMANGLYRSLPYFLAKAVSDIPLAALFNMIFGCIIYPMVNLQKGRFKHFLGLTTLHVLAGEAIGLIIGSVSPNTDTALSFLPLAIVINLIFDGRNISEQNIPKLFRWLPKISVAKWGFEGLAVNEFRGLQFATTGPRVGPLIKNGKDALDKFGLGGRTLIEIFRAQRNIILGCWVISYLALTFTTSKFEKMAQDEKDISAEKAMV